MASMMVREISKQQTPNGWCRDGDCSGNFLPANGDNTDNGPWRETNPHPFNGINYTSPDPKFAIRQRKF
jgi:hypothetical protein